MMVMDGFRLPHLEFRGFPVDGRTSVASAMPADDRKGIYMYRFTDGTYYVGKSVNMVDRYVQHIHEYRHAGGSGGQIVDYAWFAALPADASAKELDDAETSTIIWAESQGYDLRNKLKTNRPQGGSDAIVRLHEGAGLRLPWNRADRTLSTLPAVALPVPTVGQRRRYDMLSSRPEYDGLIGVLSRYVEQTIAEPQATVGRLWCVSALPSTNRLTAPRLVCVTIARVETLVVLASPDRHGRIYVNMKRPESNHGKPRVGRGLWPGYGYASVSGTRTRYYKSAEELSRALCEPATLEWCWRLNVELLRQTVTPNIRGDNPLLVGDIIERLS